MSSFYSWIYVDFENNIWKFSQNINRELCYKIMYGEGKWTKESMIDKDVLDFTIHIEDDGKMHIVYCNSGGQIKYCTLKDKQWIGRTLYLTDGNNYEVSDLKIDIIGNEMHIFYLMTEKNAGGHGSLVHCIWNGKETKSTKLLDISLIHDVKEHYKFCIDSENNIDLLFITEDGTDPTLNYCSYKNRRWTIVKRLYSIQGRDIGFELLNDQQNIHIMNKHREGSTYYLDHVRIEVNGNIQKFRVNESRLELSEPILYKTGDKVCACWLEDNKIFHSRFDGENWGRQNYFNKGSDDKIKKYHFHIASNKEAPIYEKEIYGAGESELNLFFPSEFIIEEKTISKSEAKQNEGIQRYVNQVDIPLKVEVLQNLRLQLYRENAENKLLRSTISALQDQTLKSQALVESYQGKLTKITEQKKNTDENCDMFIELQQQLQKKLEYVNRRLLEEKNHKSAVEAKLKELEEENTGMKLKIEKSEEEKNLLKKQLDMEKGKSFVERLLKG